MTEQAQVGDTVRLTIVVEGKVIDNYGLNVRGYELQLGPNRTIEILSRATPPLPTEPGAYKIDGCSGVVVLNNSGRWLDDYGAYLTMSPNTKLTRFEPVAATAKKVLNRVLDWYDDKEERTIKKFIESVATEFGTEL